MFSVDAYPPPLLFFDRKSRPEDYLEDLHSLELSALADL